jgi:putative tryptophan/tyrosine transport system substrate-binding protein
VRRLLLVLLGMLAWSLAQLPSQAQSPVTLPRVCFLTFDPPEARATRFAPFFDRLRELGHIDGQTVAVEYLTTQGSDERYPEIAIECLRRSPNVIVTATTPAASAAKLATSTIPIVMLGLGDPVGTGLVDSLHRPGGNVTGTTWMAPVNVAKRLELLKQAVPSLSRALVLTYPSDPISTGQIRALETVASALGVELVVHNVNRVDDIAAGFELGRSRRVDGYLTTIESIFAVNRARTAALGSQYALPGIDWRKEYAEGGGLMSYAPSYASLAARTATIVDRVLKGAKPTELPVEQPSVFELYVNLNAAARLGITVPPSILARADEVIE